MTDQSVSSFRTSERQRTQSGTQPRTDSQAEENRTVFAGRNIY